MADEPAPAAVTRLAEAVRNGDRRALAQALTLVESTRPDHRAQADALLSRLLSATGRAARVGVSGAPGVGKSSFIEALGLHLAEEGRRVAVLAVDPSSEVSGGSILGDKTRMERLSRHPNAFIRPSPSGGALGGVARRSRETLLIMEAAGYEVALVETVGVGQSETAVAEMTDSFLLLLAPGGGDELQGIKKGIVELADLLAVTKADGDLKPAAGRARADYAAALAILGGGSDWRPAVLTCSSVTGQGIAEVWQAVLRHREALGAMGLAAKRAVQARRWMWREVEEGLIAALRADPEVAARLGPLEQAVANGRATPGEAAGELLRAFRPGA
ncbi:MAG: methylmalonyl Co-A mutase-associated GTPase MeaB [Alphaproteobacteria bacterium]|nr:methylmalonyl Co-A mutase-associated GTPase MeaB [Alphaproteobacteria bacterium]